MNLQENYKKIIDEIPNHVEVVVVSKHQSIDKIQELYDVGHRCFGENKVQELLGKQSELPKDIKWDMIGHLQTNKVKQIIPFIYRIQSVDSLKLLKVIQKEAFKCNRVISCLLQLKVAEEETKYGLNKEQLDEIIKLKSLGEFSNIDFSGFMGMATNTNDEDKVITEFQKLFSIYSKYEYPKLSMGMSNDYGLAIKNGSNLVRVGSKFFNF